MNLLILDYDPVKIPKMLGDLHLKQQIDDVATLLCSVYANGTAPRLRRQYNHPCSVWARTNRNNIEWLFSYGVELCQEHLHRFDVLPPAYGTIYWCKNHQHRLGQLLWTDNITTFPQVIPKWLQGDDVVEAYRTYYILFKYQTVKWTKREAPVWWNNSNDYGGT